MKKVFFYGADRIINNLVKKVKKSDYQKYKAFFTLFKKITRKKYTLLKTKQEINVPVYMQFVEQQKNIDRSSALYSFEGPFQLSHIDTADIRFPAKSVQPKYCLVFVDLFTCKTYSYPMRNRSLLNKKIAFFYDENG